MFTVQPSAESRGRWGAAAALFIIGRPAAAAAAAGPAARYCAVTARPATHTGLIGTGRPPTRVTPSDLADPAHRLS